jgi:hypothetical protein
LNLVFVSCGIKRFVASVAGLIAEQAGGNDISF